MGCGASAPASGNAADLTVGTAPADAAAAKGAKSPPTPAAAAKASASPAAKDAAKPAAKAGAAAPAAAPAAAGSQPAQKHVLIFEVAGGKAKGPDGYRRDTWPLIKGLQASGVTAEVVCWEASNEDRIVAHAKGKSAFISRVEEGDLEGPAATQFAALLEKLQKAGLKGFGAGGGALASAAAVQADVLGSI